MIVENMHDVPWLRPEQLGPETVAAMTVVCSAVRRVQAQFPVGVQILSSANRAALAVAKAAGDDILISYPNICASCQRWRICPICLK